MIEDGGLDKATIEQRLEVILSSINFGELPIWKKNQMSNLIGDIKKTKKKEEKEKIFLELVELMENN